MMTANLGVLPVQAASAPRLNAKSAIIMELETGKVLYKKNIHSRRAPASMTKLMNGPIRTRYPDTVPASSAPSSGIKNWKPPK